MAANKTILRKQLREQNARISSKQRKELWQLVEDVMGKEVFYRIINGYFISDNNMPYAKAILERMCAYTKSNAKVISSILNKKRKKKTGQ